MFKEACQAAGIPNKSACGFRKAAAARAANNGATVATLEAIFDGKADRWPRSIPAPPTVAGSPRRTWETVQNRNRYSRT
jgi:hypothetical protein